MALARGWKVLLVTSVAVYLVALDVTVVNIAFPELAREFPSTSRGLLSWVLSGYNIAFAACLLTAGRVADRIGRRRVFFIGLGVFTSASALCGLAPTPGFLIASRVLQAMGGALIMPSSLALVLPEFPVARRSAAIGVWGAVGGLSAATGPVVGGLLIDAFSWRAVFYINAPICLAAAFFGRRILVESKERERTAVPDIFGAVLGTGAVGLLVLAIVQGDEWGYSSGRTMAVASVVVVLLPLFVIRCHHHRSPVLDLGLLRQRYFSVANAAVFVFSVGFFGMIFVHVLFLTGVWGYSVIRAGLAFTPGPLCAAFLAVPAGRWADRFGHRVVIAPGAALFTIGVLMIGLRLDFQPDYWGTFFPAQVMTGMGVGLGLATLNAAANKYLPPDRFAMGTAFNNTCRQVGAALGVALAVTIIGNPDPTDVLDAFESAYVFLASCVALSGLLLVILYRPPVSVEEVAPPAAVPVHSS